MGKQLTAGEICKRKVTVGYKQMNASVGAMDVGMRVVLVLRPLRA